MCDPSHLNKSIACVWKIKLFDMTLKLEKKKEKKREEK